MDDRSFQIGNSRVSIYNHQPHGYYLQGFYTYRDARGRGEGTRLLRCLVRWARIHKTRLVLFVGPYDNQPMNTEQLKSFYEKHGFREIPDFDPPFAPQQPWLEYRGD